MLAKATFAQKYSKNSLQFIFFYCIFLSPPINFTNYSWDGKSEFSAAIIQSSVSHDSLEIILICWLGSQETFLLLSMFKQFEEFWRNCNIYFSGKFYRRTFSKISSVTFDQFHLDRNNNNLTNLKLPNTVVQKIKVLWHKTSSVNGSSESRHTRCTENLWWLLNPCRLCRSINFCSYAGVQPITV